MVANADGREPAHGDQRKRQRVEIELETDGRDDPACHGGAEVGTENHRQRVSHLDHACTHQSEHHHAHEGTRLKNGRSQSTASDAL